ncbi:hypothetical protein BJ912DRAFT_935025 [Pholiota molesta]|nr:hypothetical protein BJ912DRAFT_935025 [Pholiota molesta]
MTGKASDPIPYSILSLRGASGVSCGHSSGMILHVKVDSRIPGWVGGLRNGPRQLEVHTVLYSMTASAPVTGRICDSACRFLFLRRRVRIHDARAGAGHAHRHIHAAGTNPRSVRMAHPGRRASALRVEIKERKRQRDYDHAQKSIVARKAGMITAAHLHRTPRERSPTSPMHSTESANEKPLIQLLNKAVPMTHHAGERGGEMGAGIHATQRMHARTAPRIRKGMDDETQRERETQKERRRDVERANGGHRTRRTPAWK